jgi:precorrin-8X/cobalt-precorrin-8 methylmutase
VKSPTDNSSQIMYDGIKIEQTSHDLINQYLDRMGSSFNNPGERAIIRRIIHSTADFSFADTVRINPNAIEQGVKALQNGAAVISDVKMTAAGCTHGNYHILCEISNSNVIKLAKSKNITRAAASMEFLGEKLNGAILVFGNAPTALWKVMEIWERTHGPKPAIVLGFPVGFVGAYESKLALSLTNIPYMTNLSPKGGSPVAAAAFNALVELSKT